MYITYIICPNGHLTSARFERFVCYRYIWYIFSFVCSVFIHVHVMNVFNEAQWWEKYSLNSLIKQSCSCHDKVMVYNIYTYIYIYIYIYIIHKYIIYILYIIYIYINVLYIYIYIYIWYIYIYISNPSKVKHKVTSHTHSFLSTTKHLAGEG